MKYRGAHRLKQKPEEIAAHQPTSSVLIARSPLVRNPIIAPPNGTDWQERPKPNHTWNASAEAGVLSLKDQAQKPEYTAGEGNGGPQLATTLGKQALVAADDTVLHRHSAHPVAPTVVGQWQPPKSH